MPEVRDADHGLRGLVFLLLQELPTLVAEAPGLGTQSSVKKINKGPLLLSKERQTWTTRAA